MKTFFLCLSSEQKSRLLAAGISAYDFQMGDLGGVLLEDANLQTSLALLQSRIVNQSDSPYDGIVQTVIEQNPPCATSRQNSANQPVAASVDTRKTTTQEKNSFTVAAERLLLPVIHRVIRLHHHRQVFPVIEDGAFHIHIYSSPVNTAHGVKPPATIWGTPVDCRSNAWPSCGSGHSFYDEQSKYAVAELMGDNKLYIHHDLISTGSANELRIFEHLLTLVAALLNQGSLKERLREQFVEECCKAMTRALPAITVLNSEDERELGRLNKELARLVRDTRAQELALIRNECLSAGTFAREFDDLLRVPKVKDIAVVGTTIQVFTETIFALDPLVNRYREIGAFRIDLNQAELSPRWFNLTRTVRGYAEDMHAPHVFKTGNACLGNSAELFGQLFKERQWSMAALLAIEFVESVNVNDAAGRLIGNWPEAPAQAAAVMKQKSLPVLDSAHQKYRQDYITACSARVAAVLKQARENLVAARAQIENMQVEHVTLLRRPRHKNQRAQGRKFCDRAEFGGQWADLLAEAKVKSVSVDDGVVNVITAPLHAVDARSKVRHKLGSFLIRIDLDGNNDIIRWHNQNGVTDSAWKGQHAPNVLNSGRACLREIRTTFPDLVANLQVAILTRLAIDFIEQANCDEAAEQTLTKWPAVT